MARQSYAINQTKANHDGKEVKMALDRASENREKVGKMAVRDKGEAKWEKTGAPQIKDAVTVNS